MESIYEITNPNGGSNGTYSCKMVYVMNGEEYSAALMSTEILVEREYKTQKLFKLFEITVFIGI